MDWTMDWTMDQTAAVWEIVKFCPCDIVLFVPVVGMFHTNKSIIM